MRILVCNERFLFRFGVDRCLLMLSSHWRAAGHEVVMMGTRMDPASVEKCSDRFIHIPEAPDYTRGNEFTIEYLREHWDEWFDEHSRPDVALVAGWPFYLCIPFLREKCGCVVCHDHGAVPVEGMSGPGLENQLTLQRLRRETLRKANKIIAVSRFLERTQSIPDTKGAVPTTCVLNGVDHIAGTLWATDELKLEESHVAEEVRALKEQGMKIIFQPGRWESGNYKNSAGTVQLAQGLARKGIDHRILVLCDRDSLTDVPEDVKGSYLCLGFVDDETMKALMELSDLGVMPSRWEGFDLPLGEMQYLGKKMFVLNVGAHPEVVVDPYFLCADMGEMTEKVIRELSGEAFDEKKFAELCAQYRQEFTWENRAKQMMAEIREAAREQFVLFMDVTNACRDTANGGIMRVTRKLARHLQERMETVFVIWDDEGGRFVLPAQHELKMLAAFDGPDPKKTEYFSPPMQDHIKLEEILPAFQNRRKGMLVVETAQYRMLESAVPWLQDRGIAVSAVFHDAIPVLHPEFCNDTIVANHQNYMFCLAEMDSVIPTATHNAEDLLENWKAQGVSTKTAVQAIGLAAEIDGMPRNRRKISGVPANKQILFVSTLEPRKNHIRFLKALETLFTAHPELEKTTKVHLVGKRYEEREDIPAFVENFCETHRNVKWLGVVDDRTLRAEYAACTFTAYPSEIEGFGMPIIESLWAGKPCLCSNQGSIGELAAAGGCCRTDVTDRQAMADALYRMLTDEPYLTGLQHEATERKIRGWAEYADEIAVYLQDLPRHIPDPDRNRIPLSIRKALEKMRTEAQGRRIITAGSYYPPEAIGGAEIIAHCQMRALQEEGLARGIAFTREIRRKRLPGTVAMDTWEGVPVIRVSIDPTDVDQRGVFFHHPLVNRAFRELCGIWQPQAAHFHHMSGLSMGIIDIARDCGAKTVITLHDNWGFCYRNTRMDDEGNFCADPASCEKCRPVFEDDNWQVPMGVMKSYYRRIFEKTDAFVSPSRYIANAYISTGFDAHRMHVVRNGVDYRAFSKTEHVPSEKIRITYAGIFSPHKGIDVLIRAAALVKDLNVVFSLYGSGDDEENYKKMAAECGVADTVRFMGRLPNAEMGRAYSETDIFCLPAMSPENQPVTITEAMSCGIPVIASDVGGVKELVEDSVTGYLVKAGDAEDLAEKIRKMAADREQMVRMGETGKQRMADNDFSQNAKTLAELFDTLPQANPGKRRKIILVKGRRLPKFIDRMTKYDLVPWEWIEDREDIQDAIAVMVLEGQELSEAEEETVQQYSLKVITEEGFVSEFRIHDS